MKFKAILLIGIVSISAVLFGMSDTYKNELAKQEDLLKELEDKGLGSSRTASTIKNRIAQLKRLIG